MIEVITIEEGVVIGAGAVITIVGVMKTGQMAIVIGGVLRVGTLEVVVIGGILGRMTIVMLGMVGITAVPAIEVPMNPVSEEEGLTPITVTIMREVFRLITIIKTMRGAMTTVGMTPLAKKQTALKHTGVQDFISKTTQEMRII